MEQLLGLVLISFAVTSLVMVPFIDLLYFLRRKYKTFSHNALTSDTPIHHQLLKGKDIDTPVGGGIPIILVLVLLSTVVTYFTHYSFTNDFFVLIVTLITFGFIGFLDDGRKIFTSISGKYSGIRGRYILVLQIIFAFLVGFLLYYFIGIDNIYIPVIGNIILGYWYIPVAAFAIISFANAYNISDGLDGLSSGLLMICLFAFLILAGAVFNESLSIFVGLWVGALIAYLYFNVFPARIYLGDAGAYGFGATLAVVGLLTGKLIGLGVIGGMFVLIVASSAIQLFSKKFFKRKVFPVAPIHMYFKYIGWEEPKIVARFWLAGIIFAILGLWLSLLSQ
jgi:phospho-N-acetylmuramoyl-pentapeptide-transferase